MVYNGNMKAVIGIGRSASDQRAVLEEKVQRGDWRESGFDLRTSIGDGSVSPTDLESWGGLGGGGVFPKAVCRRRGGGADLTDLPC